MKTSLLFRVLFLLILSLPNLIIHAQAPDSLWQYHLGGTSDDLGFDAIEAANPGEYILIGKTKSFGNGNFDGYLLKLDINGSKIWEKYYGGAFDEQLISVCPSHSGGYTVTGFFKSFPEGGTAVWVLFINEQGDSVLSKTHMTQHDCWGLDISPTNDQGYIVSAVMATGFGVGDEVWLLKLNAVGDTIWTARYGKSYQDYGEQVLQTSDGGYIIAGRTYAYVGPETCDAWVIKTDPDGDTLWTRTYGGNNEDMFNCVIETDDGYIFAGNAESYGSGYAEFWAVRTDDNGDTIWSRTYGDDVQNLCSEIFETAEGNYVLAGYSGLLTPSFNTYLMEIDPDGNMLWEESYGHAQANEIMYGFSPTSDGGYIATGHTTYFTVYKDELVALKLGPEGSGLHDNNSTNRIGLTVMPNPVVPGSTIRFETTLPAFTTLTLLNTHGVEIKSFIDGVIILGQKVIKFDKGNLKPGVYFLRLVSGEVQAVTKVLILR